MENTKREAAGGCTGGLPEPIKGERAYLHSSPATAAARRALLNTN